MSTIELKNGNKAIIRRAVVEDAEQLLTLSQSIIEEGNYMVTSPGELNITVDEEKQWIGEHIDSPGFAIFVAEIDTKIVGFINFQNGSRKNIEHSGSFGMSVEKYTRELGIGQSLIRVLLEWAQNNSLIEKVGLSVFADNHRAIQIYKKFGFEVEGRRKKEIKKSDGQYIDDILMYRFV
ncbi:RimJ/RimL family protein N-acetyltransferase [Geomicrobium halophilum]|uniref:RimJ/RimL family protein N-acetyltransferase n=1 Tax=Geomicrobium halophilum TaxID=549000 RepID=A0A841PV95_9BACL|nr:GNAT family N-acetyltransferase [Geomicrobium halophilum]MBB6450231.1 RimJ/RimL family protein N-acetyltransferase [Geomicrobium halophilum]